MGRIVEMPLPRLGETMEEGRIGLIAKQPGESFKRGETLLEVESDKTTVEVPALQDGILVEWLVASDQMVPVESAIARIEIEGEAVAEVKKAAVPKPAAAAAPATPLRTAVRASGTSRPRASTAARAAARRNGVDLSSVAGTGRGGRITRMDLVAAAHPARATYHADTPHGRIFVREWPAQGAAKGHALLLHGLFADSQSFTTLGRKIAAQGFRTFAVDLPGHGETASPATTPSAIAAAVTAALPQVKFHIVAHSFGAIVASHMLERARALTLLSPAGCGEEINSDFIDAMLGGKLDHALRFLGETIPPEAQASLAGQLAVNASQLRAIAAGVSNDGRQSVSIFNVLSQAAMPIQAVFMRDDAVIPVQHALNLPFTVATRIMSGLSHLPHWRDPDAIAALVAGA
jgi:pimeloyl-ACP methyl ester carboxylesterase